MPEGLPKFRGDLLVSPQESGAGAVFVVKDPVARRFFRLRDVEYFVARQLDGSTPLDVVSRRIVERFGQPISMSALEDCIAQLRRHQLLDEAAAQIDHARPRLLRGNPLYLRLKAFDPDKFLDRLSPCVGFFFTRAFLAGSAAVILLALAITTASWDDITRDFRGLYRFDALLLAWVTVLSVTMAHEFAHACTCKRFGGHVHEMGFLLLYFQPAFYCNISDAWLFPEKSRRLWVTFAGAYLELVIWALATLTWRATDLDTRLNFLALVIMATSGIKTFFNLNPLIKLDGYYLLSDYLEIPNLRQKSFTYLKALAKSVYTFSTTPSVNPDPRERRIYLGYGILATVYSSWLMTIIAVRLGSFLVDRYRGAGFVLFASLVTLTFQRSWRVGLARARTIVRWRPYTLWRPGWTRWVSLAALAAALFVIRMELKVSGEFTIMPGHNADVRSPVAGIIEEVYVNEGDHVVAGARIVRLADSEHRVELRQVESEIVEKRARLKLLRAGATPQEVDLSRQQLETARTHQRHLDKQYEEARRLHGTRQAKADAAVKTAETRLEYGQKDLGRSRDLFKAGILSRTQLDQSEEQVRLRQEELESARAELAMVLADDLAQLGGELAAGGNAVAEADGRLRVLLAGSRPEAIEAMAAEIARLEARRLYLVEQVRLATVVTPAAGVVVTPKLDQKRGEHVTHGDLIAEVFELEHVLPEIIVSEKEIGDVEVGHDVVLKVRAYPERSFTGHVKAVAPRAAVSDGSQQRVFRVTVAMDEGSSLLKPDMTGHAKIFCGRQTIAHLLTRRLARYIRVEFWSWW